MLFEFNWGVKSGIFSDVQRQLALTKPLPGYLIIEQAEGGGRSTSYILKVNEQ